VDENERAVAIITGIGLYGFFVLFCAFLFTGEPIGPSRRVKLGLEHASVLRRWLAPSVMKTAGLQLIFGILAVAGLAALGIVYVQITVPGTALTAAGNPAATEQIVVFSAYALGFVPFVIGLTAWLRARSAGAAVPRVLLLVVLFFLSAGPWIVAAIAGLMSNPSDPYGPSTAVAAPSPIYAILAVAAISQPDPGVAVIASIVMSCVYAAFGALFFSFAAARTRRIIREHETILSEADRRLAEEDRLAAEKNVPAEQPVDEPSAKPTTP
jgi:hypothetical protein